MPTATKKAAAKVPTGYRLKLESIVRLNTFAAANGKGAGEVLDELIARYIPDYKQAQSRG